MASLPLHQWDLIQRTRSLCRNDPRLVAALMYGSFVKGEGDRFSDIEFWLFIKDDILSQVSIERWINQIEPTHLIVTNEYGTQVAIFTSLVRGEFHFVPASTMARVRAWSGIGARAEEMIVVDHTGELTEHLRSLEGYTPAPDRIPELVGRYLNWIVLGINVLERGEIARAHSVLEQIDTYLLWLIRLVEEATDHWPTPPRVWRVMSPRRPRRAMCVAPHRPSASLSSRPTKRHGSGADNSYPPSARATGTVCRTI